MQKIEYVNKFTGKTAVVEVIRSRAFERLNMLRNAWNVASARMI